MPHWTEKALAGKAAAPEKLTNIPDDIAGVQKDLEAYVKGKIKSVHACRIAHLNGPGKVLVLGNPEPAVNVAGKDWKGWSCAEILNAKIPGKTLLAKSAAEFGEKDPVQSKRNKKTHFYAEDSVLEALFSEEGHCYMDDPDSSFGWGAKGGRILLNGHVPSQVKIHTGGYALIHEMFHAYEGGGEISNSVDLGWALDEGCTDYFTREFASLNPKWGKTYTGTSAYNSYVSAVTDVVSICGAEKLAKLWFLREPKAVQGTTKEANALADDLFKKDPKASGQRKTLADPKLLNAFAEAVKKHVT
jgi:hypothetical protein